MKIVQFKVAGDDAVRTGLLLSDEVADVSDEPLVEFLRRDDAQERLERASSQADQLRPLAEVELLAPVTKPDKVLCIGLNYKEHCDEQKVPYPKEPIVFSKFSSTIIGPFDDIVKPACSDALDWEVELVVVIGKKAKNVPISRAYDYVLGYTVGQDLTARDWYLNNKNGGQILLSKTMDTFCPLGPCIVTKDEIPDPHELGIRTWINGVSKQDGSTSEILHRIDALIAHISGVMTLFPGDIIMTGTPSGVGYFRQPPEYLHAGDLVESEIEKIGKMKNKVV